jgi:hypothetical protein
LFAFLEESLRDFDVLNDQEMSFWSRTFEPVIFTVALGTLDRKTESQYFIGRLGDIRQNIRRRWGHYEYRSCVLQ